MITDRHQLYESFLERYPIDWLPQMTLQEYTDLVPNESFCKLGGIKDGGTRFDMG